jgi:hypothetical protein
MAALRNNYATVDTTYHSAPGNPPLIPVALFHVATLLYILLDILLDTVLDTGYLVPVLTFRHAAHHTGRLLGLLETAYWLGGFSCYGTSEDVVVVSRGFPVKGVSVEKRAHTGKRKQSC